MDLFVKKIIGKWHFCKSRQLEKILSARRASVCAVLIGTDVVNLSSHLKIPSYPEVLCHCLLLLQPIYFVIPTVMVKAAWEEISIIFTHLGLDTELDSISLGSAWLEQSALFLTLLCSQLIRWSVRTPRQVILHATKILFTKRLYFINRPRQKKGY